MASGYKKRPLKRASRTRDAKLIIIATEGTKTEKAYFDDLTSPQWFGSPRVQVEVLQRDTTDSGPKRVLRELDSFKRQYLLDKDDELWLVIDVDDWGDAKLSQVAQLCLQKGYSLAVSNPCFELWLLFHLRSLDKYSSDVQEELFKNRKVSKDRTRLEHELLTILGSYNKSNLDSPHFLPFVQDAIERAKALDQKPDDRWPQQLGTRVYQLVNNIISTSRPISNST